MNKEIVKYSFGGKVYCQGALVMGQVKQLLSVLDGAGLTNIADPFTIIRDLGDRMPRALAVVLTPEGASPRDKDIEALATELEFAMTYDDVLKVIDDFFGCNDLLSLLAKFKEIAGRVQEQATAQMRGIGSTGSSPFSPGATSPRGTTSSGDTP